MAGQGCAGALAGADYHVFAALLTSTNWRGCVGSKQGTWNRKTRRTRKWILARTGLTSKRIIGCALTVLHALGTGFLEKIYENALMHELRKSGLAVSQQHPMVVLYDGIVVGEYAVDLLVEDMVLVELKIAKAMDEIHLAQCQNYLKATGLQLCLLLNCGKPRLEIKRIVLGL